MKKLVFIALAVGAIAGCEWLWHAPVIHNPFYHRPWKEAEKEFLHQRDNWHHHYWQDKDGNWRVEYVEKCPDAK